MPKMPASSGLGNSERAVRFIDAKNEVETSHPVVRHTFPICNHENQTLPPFRADRGRSGARAFRLQKSRPACDAATSGGSGDGCCGNAPSSTGIIGQLDSPQNVEVRARVEAFVDKMLFTE